MHEKILSVFLLKKMAFCQIKYFKCLKSEIKLKKVNSVFTSFSTFGLSNLVKALVTL